MFVVAFLLSIGLGRAGEVHAQFVVSTDPSPVQADQAFRLTVSGMFLPNANGSAHPSVVVEGPAITVHLGRACEFVCGPVGFDSVTLTVPPLAAGQYSISVYQGSAGIPAPPDVEAPLVVLAANHTALWWVPTESGWGINLNHQGDIIFATLFTYDASGAPMWLFMSNGAKQAGSETYAGLLYRATGPAFHANPFMPISSANLSEVGTMSVAFAGANSATLTYTVDGTSVTKQIQKQVYGSRAANCIPSTGSRKALANYQDLWWNPAESGWGINVTHQDDTLFATLFTYGDDGRNLWFFMSGGYKQPDGSFLGDLYLATGPAFDAQPFTPITVANLWKVGTMRFMFFDGNNGAVSYVVYRTAVSKLITRQVFSSPTPACS